MWDKVGAASGAVLGYTLGNIPGAYTGMKLGYRAGKRKMSVPYVARKRRKTGRYNKKSVVLDGTTRQRDDKTLYRKKRMPARKRRQWKKFVKKVNAVEIKDRGLQVVKYNQDGVLATTVPALEQRFKAVHLYGAGATASEPGSRDLSLLCKDAETQAVAWVKDFGGRMNPHIPDFKNNIEIRMQSAQLDMYIKNTGTEVLLIEVYHMWYVKNNNAPSFADAYAWVTSKEQIKQEYEGSSVTAMTPVGLNTFNATLFDEGQLISKLGATIKSVRQVFLGSGDVHHMQIRDPKNYSINLFNYRLQDGTGYQGYVDPKLTETYLVVAKNVDNSLSGTFTVNACRTYRYTVEGVKQPASGVVSVN